MKQVLYLCLLFIGFSTVYGQDCSIDGPLVINSQGETILEFDISGLTNDDLSGTQSICSVNLEFSHQQVTTLKIELVSPAGDRVVMVGPGSTMPTGSTPNVTWDVEFVAQSNGAPNVQTWDNNFPWNAFQDYVGFYFPNNGNFEDQNTGSANGLWQIVMTDTGTQGFGILVGATIEFCDGDGLACSACYAESGSFNSSTPAVFCAGEPNLDSEVLFQVTGSNSTIADSKYGYAVISGLDVQEIRPNVGFSDLPIGSYTICGIIYEAGDEAALTGIGAYTDLTAALSGEYCGDVMGLADCINFEVQSAPSFLSEDISLCGGEVEVVDVGNGQSITFYESGDTTIYVSGSSCESAITYRVSVLDINSRITSGVNTIDCNGTLILSGTQSSTSAGTLSYSWTPTDNIIGSSTGPTIQVNAPGNYSLEVSAGDCTDISTFEVLGGADFTANVSPSASNSLGCGGNTSATLAANATGDVVSIEWTGPGGFTGTGEEVTVTQAGTYTVVVSSTSVSCPTVTSTVVVSDQNQAALPAFNNYDEYLDCGEATVVSMINDQNVATAFWINSGRDTVAMGTSYEVTIPGSYTFSYIDNFGCTNSTPVVVNGNPGGLQINLVGPTLDCNDYGDVSQGQDEKRIFATITGGAYTSVRWQGPFNFTSTALNPIVEKKGSYKVAVEDLNGCIIRDTIDVEYMNEFAKPNFPAFDCNNTDAIVIVNPSNPDYEYRWFPEKQPFNTISTDPTLTVNQQLLDDLGIDKGFFGVEITNTSNGCTIRQFTSVTVDNKPIEVDFSSTEEIDCDPGFVNLDSDIDITKIVDFEWTGPNGFSTTTEFYPEVDEEGEYILIANTTNGCGLANGTVTVTTDLTPSQITASDNNYVFDCDNDQAFVRINSQSGPAIYQVTTPSGQVINQNVANTVYNLDIDQVGEVGDYTIIAFGANGCPSDPEIVNVVYGLAPPDVEILSFDNISCDMLESTVVAQTGGGTEGIRWSHDGMLMDEMFTTTEPGDYVITAFNSIGCEATDTAKVEDLRREIDVTLDAGVITCEILSSTITVMDAEAGLEYSWEDTDGNPLGTDDFLEVMDVDTFILNVLQPSDNCTGTIEIIIPEDRDTLAVNALPVDVIDCIDDMQPAMIQSGVTNSDSVVSVQWVLDGMVEAEGESVELSKGGSYEVQVLALNGCLSTDTLTVVELKDYPEVTHVIPDTLDCINTLVNLEVSTPATNIEYSWLAPPFSTEVEGADQTTLDVELSGEYIALVRNLDNNCVTMESIMVFGDYATPSTIVVDKTIDCNNPITNIEDQNYDPEIVATLLDPTEAPLPDIYQDIVEGGEYQLVAVGDNGCPDTTKFLVIGDFAKPQANIFPIDLDCNTDEAEVCFEPFIGSNIDYTWESNGVDLMNPGNCYKTTDTGVLDVLLRSDNGCDTTYQHVVQRFLPPNITSTDLLHPECEGDITGEIDVNVSEGAGSLRYSIDGGATYIDTSHFAALASSDYVITVVDSLECSTETTVFIEEGRIIDLQLEQDTLIDIGTTITLDATYSIDPAEVNTITWTSSTNDFGCDDCQTLVATPLNSVTYTALLEDIFGCVSEERISIEVNKDLPVYFGNIFDANQELFGVSANSGGIELVKSFSIVDRWGNVIYNLENFAPNAAGGAATVGWDGTMDGKPVAPGVYIYVAEILLFGGEDILMKMGDVTLVR